MSYHLKSKPKHEHRVKIILTVVLFTVLSLSAFLFPNFFRTVFYSISKPLWIVSDNIAKPFSSIKDYFIFRNVLIEKNLALEDELSALKLKETDYDLVLLENQSLKMELGRPTNINRILARVLSKPPRSPYDTLVIDVGSTDGLTLGNKVYFGGNIIIGLVTSITPHSSLVELFSSGNHRQEVILSRTGASFEIQGRGGENFQLEVPKDTDILWGDIFEYPGIFSSVIGNVYYIDTNSQSSFKTVYIRVPGSVFSAKFVFVEKSNN
ncbi:MAG: rod shape-determining protein MreC [Minisyncoccia bacterium]